MSKNDGDMSNASRNQPDIVGNSLSIKNSIVGDELQLLE